MTSFGLPTLAQTRMLQERVTDTKVQLDAARIEAVSGRSSNIAQAVNGDIAKVQQLQKLIADTEDHSNAIAFARAEYSNTQVVLTNLADSAQSLSTSVEAAILAGDEISLQARATEARSALTTAFSQINVSSGGRSLFSGAAVDTPPLASVDTFLTDIKTIVAGATDATAANTALDAYFAPGGAYETTIYQGSATPAPTREITEGRRVGLETTALDPEIRDTLRALATLVAGYEDATGATRDSLMNTGADALAQGSDAIIALQGRIGAREEELTLVESRNNASRFTYEQNFNALTAVNQEEAATLMRNLETQLEASYLAASRLANLSLVNYLR